jgi:cobalt-zinc-cadmium efflux system membrane fusion protein
MLKSVSLTALLVGLFGAFFIFVLDIPMPWKATAGESGPGLPSTDGDALPAVKLVDGVLHTLEVPVAVRESLGIHRDGKDNVAKARPPRQTRPLVMPGSTALDPARIVRIRARFAPCEVVRVTRVGPEGGVGEQSQEHELRPGDPVTEGQELGVFYSVDVGNKKNDLFEAIIQFRLDKGILDRAEKGSGALPDILLWNYRRNVQTDKSAVIRAKNMLKVWNIAPEEIAAVETEANQYDLAQRMDINSIKDSEWGEKQDKWARVVLKAPCSGVIIERNVSKGEIVVDNTLNLFIIAQPDRLAVLVNLPEDELPTLHALKPSQRKWTIQTVGANAVKGIDGNIDEIGYLIDPNQHTAIVKGYIDNPGNQIRAGQFVTASVNLPAPDGVVEIPTTAIVEDGRQSLVLVQTDAARGHYSLRRVKVVQRYEKTVLVRSTYIPLDEQFSAEEEEQARFKITARGLACLKVAGLEEAVLAKLKPLTDKDGLPLRTAKEASKDEGFLADLVRVLTRKEQQRWLDLVLYHAADQGILPRQALAEDTKILNAGVLELKAALLDREAKQSAADK